MIRVGRFTEEDQRAMEATIRVLGDQALINSYLLFTGGDALKNMSLTDFIFELADSSLVDVVKKFRGMYHLFNNEDKDQEQVRNLLQKTGHLRTAVPEEPLKPKDRRIVLIGCTGVGKSSSGNTILGYKKFKSGSDFKSFTTETVSGSAEVEGHQVTVVDTPGLSDVLTPQQLYKEIMRSLVEASPGPCAFVIVVKIERISKRDVELLHLLTKLFDSDISKYTVVLFTYGDNLRRWSVDEMIQSDRYMSELFSLCGGRYCVFDNQDKNDRQQVRNLLNMIEEMVTANGREYCSSDMVVREGRNQSGLSPLNMTQAMAVRAAGRTVGIPLGVGLDGVVGDVLGAVGGVKNCVTQ